MSRVNTSYVDYNMFLWHELTAIKYENKSANNITQPTDL
jgi:hypothetical protein